MKSIVVGMLAETFIHPGSGQNVGAIDLPVAREAATSYPFVAGSSLKGALRDCAEQKKKHDGLDIDVEHVFGEQDNAGSVLVSDARLLLLPVRSLLSAYKWVTCPHLLERLGRDLKRSGGEFGAGSLSLEKKTALSSEGSGRLFLEERSFEIVGKPEDDLVEVLKQLIPNEHAKERLAGQLVILHDDDFAWFARYGLAVQARNVLTENKTSKNLWYEETLPPDTLMYAVLAERNGKSGVLDKVKEIGDYLQVGGNETVGQGWFSLRWPEVGQ
jgi:CRISPR-associated protein Cmr4